MNLILLLFAASFGGLLDDDSSCETLRRAQVIRFDLPEEEQVHDVATLDIHGDGDLDVVACIGGALEQWFRPPRPRQFVAINDGEGGFVRDEESAFARLQGDATDCAVGDFDADGFDDLIVSIGKDDGTGEAHYFRGTAAGLVDASEGLPPGLRQHSWTHMRAFDLDKEAGAELLCMDSVGWESWGWDLEHGFRSLQLHPRVFPTVIPQIPGHLPRSVLVDLDGDGDQDVVRLVTTQMGLCKIDVLLNEGDGSLTRPGHAVLERDIRDLQLVQLDPGGAPCLALTGTNYLDKPGNSGTSRLLSYSPTKGLFPVEAETPTILQLDAWSAGSLQTSDDHPMWMLLTGTDLLLGPLAPPGPTATATECLPQFKQAGGRYSRLKIANLGGDPKATDALIAVGATLQLLIF